MHSPIPPQRTERLLSTPHIIFMVIAAAAPSASMIGNLPIAIARGAGPNVPGALMIAGPILMALMAGCALRARRTIARSRSARRAELNDARTVIERLYRRIRPNPGGCA
ncbi:hypothetical protein [Sphingomonas sp.]|uniref:hypothetical protein n=1 Tax=Sphingomonas sp. TaxID=28214 RepID=UPI003B3A9043